MGSNSQRPHADGALDTTAPDAKLDSSSPSSLPSSSSSSSSSSSARHAASGIQAETTGPTREPLRRRRTIQTEDDLFRVLSRKRTTGAADRTREDEQEESHEIERLMSKMFGQKRQEQSVEEQTRHSGVVFRDLTVRGVGLGAGLQPTVGDVFLSLPRAVANLFRRVSRAGRGGGNGNAEGSAGSAVRAAVATKPPVRELISGFDGCVRPGELLLVLGRPGSGCSTFLKALCNQRSGFVSVSGSVTYGGASASEMARSFRGDIIYNPEDDLHYATLSVRRTLSFALQMRTPGRESRLQGESRGDYVREFLRVVTKLFWIEHTLGTRVGNELVRGVSGGERKRVSIAEAMIARASVQGWDNSSKGLDASTALEYVRSIRAMTNMADVSTAVSLYQAGESLYDLADKVLLIDKGRCLYFGPADRAGAYFEGLGFDRRDRWTTPDFLTSVADEHRRNVRPG
ncbi:hypothetical protein E4U41_001372, partial [Claviceps citrina]